MKLIHLAAMAILVASSGFAVDNGPSEDWIQQTAFGMDCEPCAFGIERGISKIRDISRVEVDLESGTILINLQGDSEPDVSAIRQVILDNGFTPRSAQARLTGQVVASDGEYRLAMGERLFSLETTESVDEEVFASYVGQTVVIEGTIASANDWQISVKSLSTWAG